MDCEKIKKLIPDYIIGNLNPKTKLQVDDHIAECTGCKQEIEDMNCVWSKLEQIPEEEPRPEIRRRFYSMLETYSHGLNYSSEKVSWSDKINTWVEKFLPRRPVFQLGIITAMLIVGMVTGFQLNNSYRTQGEIVQLKDEVREMRQVVTNSLLNQYSAVERIQGLTMSRNIKDPDEQFLSLLLLILNSDPNVNVRLAAVNALSRFTDNSWARTELARSLSLQESPLVQISLIDLLVEIREQRALGVLRTIINDQRSMEEVKKHARWGMQNII